MKKKYYKTNNGFMVHSIMPNCQKVITKIKIADDKEFIKITNVITTWFCDNDYEEEITPTQFFDQCLRHISVIQKTLFEL